MPQESDLTIPIPAALLNRICLMFLEVQRQGFTTRDSTLFEDLDKVLRDHERKHF